MMSFARPTLMEISKKQLQLKMKAYVWVFHSLVILQLIAVFFSLGGSGSMGSGRNDLFIQVQFYSADVVIAFTMLWAFIIAAQLTSTLYKENEFMFVTNQMSHHLSDLAFLVIISTFSAILALLSGYLIKVIGYVFLGFIPVLDGNDLLDVKHLIYGILATILFITVSGAAGYAFGMLVQLNRLFMLVIPVFIMGSLFVSSIWDQYGNNWIIKVFQFYFQEANFWLFSLKMVLTIFGFFMIAILISKRLEARQ